MSENAIVLAVGKKGTGKTYRIRHIAARARRALIVDPEGKWPLVEGDEEIRTAAALFDRLRQLEAWDPAARFRLVYRDDAAVMAAVAPGAAFAVRNVTLVIDELAWLCSATRVPPWLLRVLQFGRERRVNLLGTTREPQEIHDLFFSQADLRYFFRVEPGNGLDRIRRRYRDLADDLPLLPERKFRTYGNAGVLKLIGREGA